MLKIEKAIREIGGKKKAIKFLAGIGNLTADVESRVVETKKGQISVAGGYKQSIALDYWENGEKKVKYFPIEAWGYTAEALGKLGKKGMELSVVGRVEKRTFTTKQGEQRTNEVLVIESFQITSRSFDENGKEKKIKEKNETEIIDEEEVEVEAEIEEEQEEQEEEEEEEEKEEQEKDEIEDIDIDIDFDDEYIDYEDDDIPF